MLIWFAPASTMAFWTAWNWAAQRLRIYLEARAIETAFRKAKAAIEDALKAPLTPAQHALFTQRLADLHRDITEFRLSRLSSHIKK